MTNIEYNNIPSAAVLLAAYNGERWIEEQTATILNQRGVNIHLYISLDLSTDNTFEIINRLCKKYEQITFLPYGQKFGGAAPNFYYLFLNTPIEDYDYIALSDQDDIWLEGKIKRAIDVLETENAFGYSSNVVAFWDNGKEKIIKKTYPQCEYDYLFQSPGPGCSFLLRRELGLSLRLYFRSFSTLNELDWHDWIIYAYARANKYKWVIDSHPYIRYRQHNSNQLGVNAGYGAFTKRIRDIISGYGISQTIKTIRFLNFDNHPFVRKWYVNNKIEYLVLALNAGKCRRRNRDKLFFFFACIVLAIFNPKIQ
jgi:rhamnosyltransferase